MSGVEIESKASPEDDLENSVTFRRLSGLAQMLPINASCPVAVEEALAPSFVVMIKALDNGSIQFTNKIDEANFLQLMLINHQIIVQIKPASNTEH